MATESDMSSWTDLLHSSSMLLEQAALSAQFPPLQRNLDQLEALSKKLKAKTLRTQAPAQSFASTRLLAREGINAEQLARDLKSFELKTTFEDVFPAEATRVEENLQQNNPAASQELNYLFGGTTTTSDMQWKSNSSVVQNYKQDPVPLPQEAAQDGGTPGVVHETQQQSSTDDVGFIARHTRRTTPQGVKRKKLSGATKIGNTLNKLIEYVESRSRSTCTTVPEHVDKGYTIKDCVDILNQTSNVPVGSELYMDSLDIFREKSNREIFVSIPSEVRLVWLQRQMRL